MYITYFSCSAGHIMSLYEQACRRQYFYHLSFFATNAVTVFVVAYFRVSFYVNITIVISTVVAELENNRKAMYICASAQQFS